MDIISDNTWRLEVTLINDTALSMYVMKGILVPILILSLLPTDFVT